MLEETTQGPVLPVKANPGARRNAITGLHNGALKLSVIQVPEKGRANAAIIEVLAEFLGISASRIELVGGARTGQKRFLIRNISTEALSERIQQLLDD